MQINVVSSAFHHKTHEGAPARSATPEQQLRRSVMACMLWEDTFYESGVTIADRIADLVKRVDPSVVANMAVSARTDMKLRHAPLLLCRELARIGKLKAETLAAVIQRADEMGEFLALYAQGRDGVKRLNKLSNQVRKGLARAFTKFNAYQLSKYNRTGEGKVTLRDVLFLCHPKPATEAQAETWKQLVGGTLAAPDTWEVALSGGADKCETFTRLVSDGKLGALALLRNLRNMVESGVHDGVIRNGIAALKPDRVLPFRFVSAAKHAPRFEPELEAKMYECAATREKMAGRTALLVDVSPSMVQGNVSAKSDIDRLDAACALAILLRETGSCDVFTFDEACREIAPRRGFALRDQIRKALGNGTRIGNAVQHVNALCKSRGYDRMIVVTDEQSQDTVGGPAVAGYMVNVAAYQNGVGYGPWTNISGWSESVVDYIVESEREPLP